MIFPLLNGMPGWVDGFGWRGLMSVGRIAGSGEGLEPQADKRMEIINIGISSLWCLMGSLFSLPYYLFTFLKFYFCSA